MAELKRLLSEYGSLKGDTTKLPTIDTQQKKRLLVQYRYTKQMTESNYIIETESAIFDIDEPIGNIIEWYNTSQIDKFKTNLEAQVIYDKQTHVQL